MLLACTNLGFDMNANVGGINVAPESDVHVVQGRIDGTASHRTRISGAPSDLL